MNAFIITRSWVMLLTFLVGVIVATKVQAQAQGDETCMRCHSMATLSYLDAKTGLMRNLAIDPQAMAQSDHRQLKCRDCHAAGYEAYPHFEEARRERLDCFGCHDSIGKFPKDKFEIIERGFQRSIHYQNRQDSLNCFSCHNPHDFRQLAGLPKERLIPTVARDNGVCRRCHDSPEGILGQSGRLFLTLEMTHSWLPETERHWSKIRCVECHTSSQQENSHFILGRDYAVRACEACHSRDSILAVKLYRHRTREERRTAGFIHSVVMNDAYVIGMTRNQWLDWGGMALIGLTIVGVGAHGLARFLVGRSMRHETRH
ncbi:MAG: hypothetical protein G8237_07990 [Magnetococcales bacterium]|nr:hypothetical protein [Magnetococcales bacterium]